MDKKIRSHRRSPSSSSSSSTSSSTSSSSSSSSSYDSRRPSITGKGNRQFSYKDAASSSSRQTPRKARGSRKGSEKSRAKKKSISTRKHTSSKGSSRKGSSHGTHRDISSKEYDRSSYSKISHSPSRHHKRTSSKKRDSSPVSYSSSRKSRKQASPSSIRRDRLDYHAKVIEKSYTRVIEKSYSLNKDSSLGPRTRAPRTDDRTKRSPEANLRDRYIERDSPRRYDREEYVDRKEKRSSMDRPRDIDRKESQRNREYDHHERDSYEGHREEREKDPRERDPREKKLLKERILYSEKSHRERESDDRRGDYTRQREVIVRGNREYEDEREFYPRESRESSLDRPYDDPYDRYGECERGRYEGPIRHRYDDLHPADHRASNPEYGPVGDIRGHEDRFGSRAPSTSMDPRFPEDRRKSHHEGWEDRKGFSVGPGSMDRLQEKPDTLHYPQGPPPHRRPDWVEPGPVMGRAHNVPQWNKKIKRVGGEWGEEYPMERGEWMDGPDWPPEPRDRLHPLPPGTHMRGRYGPGWNEGERGVDWAGPSIQDRIGGRGPPFPGHGLHHLNHPMNRDMAVPVHKRIMIRKEGLPEPDVVVKTPNIGVEPRPEPEVFSSPPSIKRPISESSFEQLPIKQPKGDPQPPPSGAIVPPKEGIIEKDNFSDFSDDPDDILNQDVLDDNEELNKDGNNEGIKQPYIPFYEDMLEEEEQMDLEEISDDELEEEKQAKFSVADALDINWSSLMNDIRPTPAPTQGSALKRFRPLHLLARLGISTKYARPEVLQSVTETCLKIEAQKMEAEKAAGKKIIPVCEDSAENTELNGDKKDSLNVVAASPEPLPEILPVVGPGGVVKYLKQQATARSKLFSLGPNRRALCAREDLALRRRLCNLPEQDYIGPNVHLDKQLYREAVNLVKSH